MVVGGGLDVWFLWILTCALVPRPLAGEPRVVAVNIHSTIHPVTTEIVGHALDQAKRDRAAIVLLRLNTPGGLLEATQQTIQKIVAAPVPVVAYVTPSGGRAASAGFFLLQAADVAAMANGTHTGAAAPVMLGQTIEPVMRQKIENDTSAFLRSLAERRGRNAALAEKAVRESKSFTEKEAMDNHLIDLIVADEATLLRQLDGREVTRFDGRKSTLSLKGAQVVDYPLTLRERALVAVSDPNLAFLMLMVGALGLYAEFATPGLILPGVAGGILVLIGLMALSVLPINWTGAALLILAIALFVLEAKVASHGVLGIGGTVAMVLGAMLLVDGPPEMRIHLSTALAVSLPFALITIFLVSLIVRARATPVVTGEQGLLNDIGVALTDLSPSGKVQVHGEYWDATASSPVALGGSVRVTAVEGLKLKVEPVPRGGERSST